MAYVLSNLDMEYVLAGQGVPRALGKIARSWAAILGLIKPGATAIDPVDGVAATETLQADQSLICWGLTPAVRHLAQAHDLILDAPPAAVVAKINAKTFSHALERRLGLALPGACRVASLAALDDALDALDGPWLLKHPWGVSGRRQQRGQGGLTPDQRRWAQTQLAHHHLIVEPRVAIDDEFSLHFQIHGPQKIDFRGACRLLADRTGTFRGIEVDADLSIPAAIVDGAHRAAQAVADAGYFGPLGIDAMVGRCQDRRIERPITEINGRYTFGRLALALASDCPDWRLTWHHPPRRTERPALEPWPKIACAGRFYLPDAVDPGGRSRTWVELARR